MSRKYKTVYQNYPSWSNLFNHGTFCQMANIKQATISNLPDGKIYRILFTAWSFEQTAN
jgi:hypothetical protein